MAELIVYMPDHVPGDQDPAEVSGEIVGNLVRCKDCKYGSEVFDSIVCRRHQPKYRTKFGHGQDWFCADGVLKD